MSVKKIAILLDGDVIASWQQEIIERIDSNPALEISAFIVKKARSRRPITEKLFSPSKVGWFMLDRGERLISRLLYRTPNALAPCSLRARMGKSPVIEVTPETKRHIFDYFSPDDVAKVRALDLDVMIRFGFDILRGDILTAARYGIWSYHHGDTAHFRGGPSCFWEWFQDSPLSSATLQILTPDLDNGIVLQKGHYMTFSLSWNENRNRVFWKSTVLLTDCLEALTRSEEFVEEAKSNRQAVEDRLFDGPLLVTPRLGQSVAAAWKLFRRYLGVAFRHVFYIHQWRILLCSTPSKADSLRKYQEVLPPKDRFWADPFFVRRDDKTFIFVEEYKYRRKIGEIAVLECENDKLIDHRTIMSGQHHLSYPFLFEHEDALYMIPETHQKRTIQLWRSTEFPDRWEHVRDLMTGVSAVDTTLFEHDGRWWMFTNIDRSRLGSMHLDELHAFHADSPLSTDWQPHAQNPLIRDASHARQGGRVYRDARGRLVRVAQNNTHRYGYSLSFHEILELTPDRFETRLLSRVEPTWSKQVRAIHNFDTDGKTFVFDACFKRPKFA